MPVHVRPMLVVACGLPAWDGRLTALGLWPRLPEFRAIGLGGTGKWAPPRRSGWTPMAGRSTRAAGQRTASLGNCGRRVSGSPGPTASPPETCVHSFTWALML
jgi:hypothetical protein